MNRKRGFGDEISMQRGTVSATMVWERMTFRLENQGPVAAIAERSSKIKMAILIYLSAVGIVLER